MTWEIPWVISGVPSLPLSVARLLAYVSTRGNTGVVEPGDLKITATSTPSNQIQTASGVFVAATRFLGADAESYVGHNTALVSTTVPNTGGSPRYDFVYAHITDPDQVGQPGTPDAVETRVVTNVSSTATLMSDVPALDGQTGVPLARIYRGASATIVNPGDITDIRELANTQSLTKQLNVSTTGSETISGSSYLVKPSQATWSTFIPAWANRVSFSVSTTYVWTATGTEVSTFEFALQIASTIPSEQATGIVKKRSLTSAEEPTSFLVAGTHVIPSNQRGTTQTISLMGRRTDGTGTLSLLTTSVYVTLTFYQEVE